MLTIIWIVLLLLTGKYWCPLFFWRDSPQCPPEAFVQQLGSMVVLPSITLIVGLIIGWIIARFRARRP
ncbi:MAG: hypothetical protein V4517_29120 [Pseudomonadota bacterium]